jgi:hypothetical protein
VFLSPISAAVLLSRSYHGLTFSAKRDFLIRIPSLLPIQLVLPPPGKDLIATKYSRLAGTEITFTLCCMLPT